MSHITSQRLLPVSEVSSPDLYSVIDLALIDEQGRKVDLFGRVAACFICRGETSPGRGNVELLHPDGEEEDRFQARRRRPDEKWSERKQRLTNAIRHGKRHTRFRRSYIANYSSSGEAIASAYLVYAV